MTSASWRAVGNRSWSGPLTQLTTLVASANAIKTLPVKSHGKLIFRNCRLTQQCERSASETSGSIAPTKRLIIEKTADASQSPDDLILVYLVELDVVAEEQAIELGAFPPVRT
ncbi:MAG: hypothetical protein JWQ17_1022 [Tardiphaga sp.]|nr:hypothetical protein [Tardiphaga sp.]